MAAGGYGGDRPARRGVPGGSGGSGGPSDGASVGASVVSASTDAVPPAERFAWWTDMVADHVMPVTARSEYAARFRASVEAVDMPGTQVSSFSFSPMSARRSLRQIRRVDPENYYVVLVRGGAIRLTQERRTACVEPGGMVLLSTSHPVECDFVDRGRQVRTTMLMLPRTALPLGPGRADRLLAEPFPVHSGAAALLGPYLTQLPHAARDCASIELARLGAVGVDLAATVLATRLGALSSLPAETRKNLLLTRIQAFIEEHLPDSDLTPKAIATHHHLSVRTLHQLFREEPESVATTIRRRRLERARTDLLDPALKHRTIAETAARWGFRNPGDFSRAFRAEFGESPGEARRGAI